MPSQIIRWLHLSDFHVGKDDYAQRKMFEYIIGDVRKKKAEGFTPDFIFITGDLANKGLSAEYMDFWLEFVEPLQAEIGDGIEQRIFVVPGNHDVDRTHNQAFSREEMSDDIVFRDARAAVAVLGQELNIDSANKNNFRQLAEECKSDGAKTPTVENAFDIFRQGVIAAETTGVDDAVEFWIPDAASLNFGGLHYLIYASIEARGR